MNKSALHIIICIIVAAAVSSCGSDTGNRNLDRIDNLAETAPSAALAALDSIDSATLSEGDRHLYELLRVKAEDKAYIPHTSDSAITEAIKYYERKDDIKHYAEALYYDGRVTFDMGDYPVAIRLYQNALDVLPETDDNRRLRSAILSHTASALIEIMLYNQAIPYIKEALEIDRLESDTFNRAFDNLLLANSYCALKDYNAVDSALSISMDYGYSLPPETLAYIHEAAASCSFDKRDYKSALKYIRSVPTRVKTNDRLPTLEHAAMIYLKNGIADTAYIYARKLTERESMEERMAGYEALLDKSMRRYSSADSLMSYLDSYVSLIRSHYSRHESTAALIQNSYYNYSRHERERVRAEREIKRTKTRMNVVCMLAVALVVLLLFVRYRAKARLLKMHKELESIRQLRDEITNKKPEKSGESSLVDEMEHLRQLRREELLAIAKASGCSSDVPAAIKDSDAYRRLLQCIADGTVVVDSDPLWDELEKSVLASSPKFKNSLRLLTGNTMNTNEYRIALLVKCGVSPTDMTVLMSREKGTISYRRESLSLKIFDRKVGVRTIDAIIRAL